MPARAAAPLKALDRLAAAARRASSASGTASTRTCATATTPASACRLPDADDQDNPDPLKADPVATVIDGCVGCGLCGANAHAATLCPSFYRAEVVQNPRWHERCWLGLRSRLISLLQPARTHPIVSLLVVRPGRRRRRRAVRNGCTDVASACGHSACRPRRSWRGAAHRRDHLLRRDRPGSRWRSWAAARRCSASTRCPARSTCSRLPNCSRRCARSATAWRRPRRTTVSSSKPRADGGREDAARRRPQDTAAAACIVLQRHSHAPRAVRHGALAREAGTVISAVMLFGAIAALGLLPFRAAPSRRPSAAPAKARRQPEGLCRLGRGGAAAGQRRRSNGCWRRTLRWRCQPIWPGASCRRCSMRARLAHARLLESGRCLRRAVRQAPGAHRRRRPRAADPRTAPAGTIVAEAARWLALDGLRRHRARRRAESFCAAAMRACAREVARATTDREDHRPLQTRRAEIAACCRMPWRAGCSAGRAPPPRAAGPGPCRSSCAPAIWWAALALRLLASASGCAGDHLRRSTDGHRAGSQRSAAAASEHAPLGLEDCPLPGRLIKAIGATNERGKRNPAARRRAARPRAASRSQARRRRSRAARRRRWLTRPARPRPRSSRMSARRACWSRSSCASLAPTRHARLGITPRSDDAAATAARRHGDECNDQYAPSGRHGLLAAALLLAGSAFAQQAQEEPILEPRADPRPTPR